jgi:chromosome partitioning protein
MARIYTIVNQKGGVGKTTTAINLGAYLGYYGQRVLLVDIDPQANATSSLGIDKNTVRSGSYEVLIRAASVGPQILHNPRLKLSLLPSTPALAGSEVELVEVTRREYRLREALQNVRDRYDYVLIDCPPSLGLLTVNGLVAAQNGVIIPVQCEYLALEGLGQLTQTITRVRNGLFAELEVRGVILTMYDPRTNLTREIVTDVPQRYGIPILDPPIPKSVKVAEAPRSGYTVLKHAPSSRPAIAYRELADTLLLAPSAA